MKLYCLKGIRTEFGPTLLPELNLETEVDLPEVDAKAEASADRIKFFLENILQDYERSIITT